MLINCNSCKKKFTLPDTAVTEYGRLLQCSSCGNKWTQYPIKENSVPEIKKTTSTKVKKSTNEDKIKTSVKKKKREISLYSEEYLKKKYGLTLKDTSEQEDKKGSKRKQTKSSFGFYNYLVTISILLIALIGFLNLSKDIITERYPLSAPYINYLFEAIDVLRVTVSRLINLN